MTPEDDGILDKAIGRWGEDHQLIKAAEEASEYIAAILQNLDGRDNADHVAEETADVIITLRQVVKVVGIEDAVDVWVGRKMRELSQRIEEA